jgi:hypothetical protein
MLQERLAGLVACWSRYGLLELANRFFLASVIKVIWEIEASSWPAADDIRLNAEQWVSIKMRGVFKWRLKFSKAGTGRGRGDLIEGLRSFGTDLRFR